MIDVVKKPDPLLTQAANKVADMLGLQHGDVTISRDPLEKTEQRYYGMAVGESDTKPTKREAVDLYFTIHKPSLDVKEVESIQQVRTGLSKFQSISNVVQMTPIEVETDAAIKALHKVAEGTSFNTKLLENFNFDPEVAKEGRTHNHLMSSPQITAYGAEFEIIVEGRKGEDVSQKTKDIAEYFKKDEGVAFKTKVGGRVAKYVEENFVKTKLAERKQEATPELVAAIKTEFKEQITKEQTAAKENIASLKVQTDTDPANGRFKVALRSQQQIDAIAKDQSWRYQEPANADELRSTNALHLLDTKVIEATETTPRKEAQIYRALGRALQDIPHYTEVAGIVDMRNLIGKEMARIFNAELKDKPEKQALLQKISKSPIFLEHHNQWGHQAQEVGDAPADPKFRRIAHNNDMLEVQLTLTRIPNQKDPVASLLEGIINEPITATAKTEAHAIPPLPPTEQAIVTAAGATPEAAAAGNITVCSDPNHAAVSASGAAATPEGAVAGAGGACVDKNNLTPEAINAAVAAAVNEQAAVAAPVPPVVAAPPVVDTPKGIEVGGQKISNSSIANFLKKQPSAAVGEVCGCGAAMPAYAHSKA